MYSFKAYLSSLDTICQFEFLEDSILLLLGILYSIHSLRLKYWCLFSEGFLWKYQQKIHTYIFVLLIYKHLKVRYCLNCYAKRKRLFFSSPSLKYFSIRKICSQRVRVKNSFLSTRLWFGLKKIHHGQWLKIKWYYCGNNIIKVIINNSEKALLP